MATINSIGNSLDGITGTGKFVGDTSPTMVTPTVDSMTIVNTPVNPTDAVNVSYVSAIASGIELKLGCYAATVGSDLGAIYLNGASGVGATLTNAGTQAVFALDGTTPPIGSRILVKDQTLPVQNGVYTLTTVGSVVINWVLTRATDFDAPTDINPGDLVPVSMGTVNAVTSWVETSTVTTIGTDPITFSPFTFGPSTFLIKANNLSDVPSASTARSNLGLTNVAIQTTTANAVLVGAASNTIASIAASSTAGALFRSNGTGVNPGYTTASYPSTTTINQLLYSSAANVISGLATLNNGVLITNNTGVPSLLANGTPGFIFTANSGAPPSWQANPGAFSPNSVFNTKDDFVGFKSNGTSEMAWTVGGLSSTIGVADPGHDGVLVNSGSTNASLVAITDPSGTVSTGNCVFMGGGVMSISWVFKITTLSNGTNRYIVYAGLGNSTSGNVQNINGVYFVYSDNINGGNWVGRTANGGTRTNTNSSIPVTTGWHNATIVVNAAGTSVEFFIDGVSLGLATTTNIPAVSTCPQFNIDGTVVGGIPAGAVALDLFYMSKTYTTPR